MKTEVLQRIGFTNNEIKTYLALLELGESLASKIATKINLNRSLIYKILEDLIRKGFVSFVIKENRKYFSAASPNKLLSILKENETEVQRILPELLNLKKSKENAPKVEIFAGKEGMKTMLEDVLKIAKEIFVLGAKSDFSDKLYYYHPNWHRRRIKQRIIINILFEQEQKVADELLKLKHTEIRFLPKQIKSKIMIAIYGDKVAIELWYDYPITILITDHNTAEGFKSYFNLLWKLAKK